MTDKTETVAEARKPAGVIETHHANGDTEWGYSFTSHNPHPGDYVRLYSEEDAWRLADRIERALAQQPVTALDASAPPRLWLQIDPDGDPNDRSEPIPRDNWDELTWHYESVGGLEVEYVRADLASPQPAPQPVEYDRELIANMLHDYTMFPDDDRCYSDGPVAEQVRMLRAAGARTVPRESQPDEIAMALDYSRNFANANPGLSSTAREHILGLCTLLERVAGSQPAVEVTDAMVELGARGICNEMDWDPDAPGTYSGSTKKIRNPDGSLVPQWQLLKRESRAALTAALQPVAAHTDDIAVDRFAAAMKAKLAAARAKGRGGWEGSECNADMLSRMLREHVEKGDPRDVANFCAFLWNRGEPISAALQLEKRHG